MKKVSDTFNSPGWDIALTGIGVGGMQNTTMQTIATFKTARIIYHLTPHHQELQEFCTNVINLESVYWSGEEDTKVYKRLVEIILRAASEGPGVVVVGEGHPTIYDDVSWQIYRKGKRRGYSVVIQPAVSCLDAMAAHCELEFSADGLQILEASSLVDARQPLNPFMDTLIMQIGWFHTYALKKCQRGGERRFKPLTEYLMNFYPADHEIRLLRAPSAYASVGDTPNGAIHKCRLNTLHEQHTIITLNMSLFIPAVGESEMDGDAPFKNSKTLKYLRKLAALK